MLLHSLFALTLIIADAPNAARLPSADEIVPKMVQRDDERRSELQGYARSGTRVIWSRVPTLRRNMPCFDGSRPNIARLIGSCRNRFRI
jgi:hypothetical protein